MFIYIYMYIITVTRRPRVEDALGLIFWFSEKPTFKLRKRKQNRLIETLLRSFFKLVL